MNVNVNLKEENVIQINGGTTINVDVSVKNIIYVKKDYIWNSATCCCKYGKYLASIIGDLVITFKGFLCKTIPGAKPFCIWFEKIYVLLKKYMYFLKFLMELDI